LKKAKTKRITLADVAAKAGVSVATASVAITGRRSGNCRVSPAVAEKIRAVAHELHYRPNLQARNLSTQRTHNVAMLIKRAVDPVPAPVAVQHAVAPAPVVTHAAIREPMRETPSQPTMSPRPMLTAVPDEVRSLGPKKKPMLRELASDSEDAVPVYAQPPFWARSKSS